MQIAKWIWLEQKNAEVNSYVDFYQEFNVDSLKSPAELRISCETNFVVWVNRKLIGTGQFSDYPRAETYSTFELSDKLIKGENTIAILAYHCGVNYSSYISAEPGLWFELRMENEISASSGKSTKSRISPVYRQGEIARSTIQMGFTFECDLSKEHDSRWQASREISDRQPIPRPLPVPVVKNRTPFQIVAQGVLKRTSDSSMQHDYLSSRRANEIFLNVNPGEIHHDKAVQVCVNPSGIYIVVDMQREECGFIDLELEAPANMMIDFAVGEHLADLRVRSSIGGRLFASRLITKNGKQRFTHYITRAAGRYLQLHFTNITDAFTLEYAGMLPFEYPLSPTSTFKCADSIFNKIYETSCRTLELCMHEHYEDCPWREQALYANDSRNQALTGYYTFGEYDFPAVSFELLSRSADDDGYMTLCAPMASPFTIPSFTMVWFLAMADHLLYSGNLEYAKTNLPLIHKCLGSFIKTMKNNLLPSPTGPDYWHFYDWADGLSGANGSCPETKLNEERYDAPLNFLFMSALRAAAEICGQCGETTAAELYRKTATATAYAAHKMFWNQGKELYCTGSSQAMKSLFAELTQALALLTTLMPSAIMIDLRAKLAQQNNGMVKTTLSQCLYKFEALLQEKNKYGLTVFTQISNSWSKMLYTGATCFWETEQGQADFDYAGSLCHGWSATPAYFYGAYILGAKPLTPGFKTFIVDPFFKATPQAFGTIPTPSGDITVSWHENINEDGDRSVTGEIRYPASLTVSSKPEHFRLIPYSL